MANVVNRITKEYRRSVNTPDYNVADWIINPDVSALVGVPTKYWVISGDTVTEMDQAAKDAVDAAETAAALAESRAGAIAKTTLNDGEGIHVRELIELFNKRDNYLVNRIEELQSALDAMKASSGNAANLRDAIPASWLPTNTRSRAQAVQNYIDDINAGLSDT